MVIFRTADKESRAAESRCKEDKSESRDNSKSDEMDMIHVEQRAKKSAVAVFDR